MAWIIGVIVFGLICAWGAGQQEKAKETAREKVQRGAVEYLERMRDAGAVLVTELNSRAVAVRIVAVDAKGGVVVEDGAGLRALIRDPVWRQGRAEDLTDPYQRFIEEDNGAGSAD